jgi:hypothetical protein
MEREPAPEAARVQQPLEERSVALESDESANAAPRRVEDLFPVIDSLIVD